MSFMQPTRVRCHHVTAYLDIYLVCAGPSLLDESDDHESCIMGYSEKGSECASLILWCIIMVIR